MLVSLLLGAFSLINELCKVNLFPDKSINLTENCSNPIVTGLNLSLNILIQIIFLFLMLN